MRFSIFTPTHDPRFIDEAYASLHAQTLDDWEWVIVPNGGAAMFSDAVCADDRVRIIPAPSDLQGVGALKRFACGECNGDYLVELDHDDFLIETALETLAAAIEEHERPGFLFSDFVDFRPDGSSRVFESSNWRSYPTRYRDRDYTAMRAFEADPSALHKIVFAPNHVRVWEANTYHAAGGHDPKMDIADDHDLLCRTYLTGAKMVHVPEPLYFYRLIEGGENTYLKRNADIQVAQQQVSNKYVYRLIEEWCRREDLQRVELKGPYGSESGFDVFEVFSREGRAGLNGRLPYDDESVGWLRAIDVLARVPHCRDAACPHAIDGAPICVVGLMNECYRVLAPGGWLQTRNPSTDGRDAFADPMLVSYWNENSFQTYTHRDWAKNVPGLECRFQAPRIWQGHPSDWHRDNDAIYVFADLVALKGQHQPGVVNI